jgi:signal transduction histidine kinase
MHIFSNFVNSHILTPWHKSCFWNNPASYLALTIQLRGIVHRHDMTNINRFILILAAAICFSAPAAEPQGQPKVLSWAAKKLPRLDQSISVESAGNISHDFIIDDFDGDGAQELCQLRTDSNHPLFVTIRELDRPGYTYPGHAQVVSNRRLKLFPLAGIGDLKFATYRQSGTTGWIDLYNHRAEKVDSVATLCGVDASGDGEWTGTLQNVFLQDVNDDKRLDLLAHFNTGADQQPRALVAYDLMTKKSLLELHFAPMLTSAQSADFDDDGSKELVLCLAGASDGPSFGPFSRDSSYVVVIGGDGQLRASRAFLGESSYVTIAIADVDGDLLPDIIATSYSLLQGTSRRPAVLVLDGRTLEVQARLNDFAGLSPVIEVIALDLERDGIPEIILTDLAGRVAIARYDLEERKLVITAVARAGSYALEVAADDINGDGKAELFFAANSPQALWLVDRNLQPLAWMPLQSNAEHLKLAPLDLSTASMRFYSYLDGGALQLFRLPVEAFFPQPAATAVLFGKSIQIHSTATLYLASLLAIMLLGVFYFILKRVLATRFPGTLFSNRIGRATVDGKGLVANCNPYFLRLIGREQTSVLKHPLAEVLAGVNLRSLLSLVQTFNNRNEIYWQQEIDLPVEGKMQNIAVELIRDQSAPAQVVMLLVDLSESLQRERLKIWAAMALRMAHKTKTPLATVLLAIQRLQRAYKKNSPDHAPEYEELSTTAIREIERVRDSINTFMKFARLDPPVFVPDDLSRVVQECLQEYLPRIPDEVQVRTQFETLELPVNIDVSQFKEAFNNLLDNAITAIHGQGLLAVSTLREKNPLHQSGEKDQALLEITDNGDGIPANIVPQLFTPGFSTSLTGTGMGLVLAQSIIEIHGGTIEIDTQRMSGTIVFVRLPICSA